MKSLVFLLFVISMLFLSASLGLGTEPNSQPSQKPPSKEALDQIEEFDKIKNSLENLNVLMEQTTRRKYMACIKTFGSLKFCECIRDETPVGIDFSGYVQIVTSTREELKYAEQDEQTKKLIDATIHAREVCVQKVK